MFQSGCRVGEEYKMAWELMREKAGQGTAYLGEEHGKQLEMVREAVQEV